MRTFYSIREESNSTRLFFSCACPMLFFLHIFSKSVFELFPQNTIVRPMCFPIVKNGAEKFCKVQPKFWRNSAKQCGMCTVCFIGTQMLIMVIVFCRCNSDQTMRSRYEMMWTGIERKCCMEIDGASKTKVKKSIAWMYIVLFYINKHKEVYIIICDAKHNQKGNFQVHTKRFQLLTCSMSNGTTIELVIVFNWNSDCQKLKL